MQTIKAAICSFGMSGWVFHAPFLDIHPGFEFYAVWERSKNLAQERYPQVTVYRTFESLLADDAIELVIVNTPNTTHYEYTKMALLAGKHVVCEKPFTVTVQEAAELTAIAKEQQKILTVYHNRRYDSDFRTIRSVLEKGLIGNIVEAEFHFDRFKEEISPKAHKEVSMPGTGCLYDLGSHLIDQAIQLFGMPEAVFADITIMRPVSKVDDYFELLLYYPKHRVRLKASYQVREALPGYILHGSKGSFIKPKTDVQEGQLQALLSPTDIKYGVEPASERGLLHTETNGQIVREYLDSHKGNYLDYYEGVFQSIRNHQPLQVNPEEATQVIQIIEAAFKSSLERTVVKL